MFEWKETYNCGIESIDHQHRKLLSIGERLADLLKMSEDIDCYDEIIDILTELKEYTVYHFDYEEKLLQKYNYEDLRSHKRQHKSFINKIEQLSHQDLDEKQEGIKLHMIEFLANWIENHILKTDYEYRNFLKFHGIK